jgi:hypothetical protein
MRKKTPPEKRTLHVKESRMVFTQYRLLTSGPSFVSRTRLAIRQPPTIALQRRGRNGTRKPLFFQANNAQKAQRNLYVVS